MRTCNICGEDIEEDETYYENNPLDPQDLLTWCEACDSESYGRGEDI